MAVTTVTTAMAGAINYTVVTDTSADWPSVANNTYFYDKADKLVRFKNSSGTILEIFSAGGLSFFTEAQSTTAPNATVNVDSLTAVAGTTNADFAIVPKGTGAIVARIPNNATTGGNKRGAGAVDLQIGTQAGADRVASGNYSFTAGQGAQASGDNSVAFNGIATNTSAIALQGGNATNTNSIAIGLLTTASGSQSLAMAGRTGGGATASGDNSVAIGASATASGFRDFAFGTNSISSGSWSFTFGKNVTANSVDGRIVNGYTATDIGVIGDTQKSTFFLGVRTTGNTATTVTVGGGAASATNQVILSNQSAYRFKGTIIGKQSGSTNVAAWDVDGLIVRGANAAATTLVVSNVNVVDNTPTFGTPTLAADTTNGGLRVQVTGVAATNIQWTAIIETTEVIYA